MKYIVIDGNIGSGKSTLITHLQQTAYFGVINLHDRFKNNEEANFFIETEDTEEWMNSGWLEKFYINSKFSFGFQMKVILSHIKQFNRMIEVVKENDVLILERSAFTSLHVFGKLLLEDGVLDQLEFDLQKEYIESLLKPPDVIIYLEINPEDAFQRIIKRSREGEQISLDYIRKVNSKYDEYLKSMGDKTTVFKINATNSCDNVLSECCKYII